MTRKSVTLKQENVDQKTKKTKKKNKQTKKKEHYVEPIQVVLMTMMIFL